MQALRFLKLVFLLLPLSLVQLPGLVLGGSTLGVWTVGAWTLGLWTVATSTATPARADVIELRADHWCPFNCAPGSAYPGFLVELTREALSPFGHELRYANLSWSRSIAMVQSGAINGIIGTDPDEVTDLIFSIPLGQYQEAMAFRRGEAREITGLQDLEGLRLGGIQDYEYSAALNTYIADYQTDPARVQLLTGENGLRRNLRKLLAHRIDLVLEEYSVLRFAIKNALMEDQIDIIRHQKPSVLHIGFSPALESSHLYVRQLAEGIAQLRSTGRYGEILARYGLQDN